MGALLGAGALLLAAAPLRAAELRSGTTLSVRLATHVSSHDSRAGDPVEALVISPIRQLDRLVLSPGSRLRGHVVRTHRGFVRHAALKLAFDELVVPHGRSVRIEARVTEVDNAREDVAEDGTIVGLPSFTSAPSVAHIALLIAAHAHPLLLALVEAGRFAKEKGQHTTIDYGPGVELELRLDRPAWLPDPQLAAQPGPPLQAAMPARLARTVESLPVRTASPTDDHPADLTNVLLVGTRRQVEAAFAAAGWSQAVDLTTGSAARGLLALAEKRAYAPAPVSGLELSGRPPDLVFEKQCNTLVKRHHVRLWGGFGEPDGPALWVGAATHDVGIVFSRAQHRFTHRVDEHIDRERAKIVDDLEFTGLVADTALLERPAAPRAFSTATGASIETDGRMAVVVLGSRVDGPSLVASLAP